jgi:hypothetical protein
MAVQKASLGKIGNAGAGCSDKHATRVPLAQPRHERRAFRDPVELVPAGRGDKNDVGVLDVFDCAIRSQHQRAGRTDFASIDRCGSHPKLGLLGFAIQPIPDHAGRMEYLDGSNGRGRVAVLENNDGHVEQATC